MYRWLLQVFTIFTGRVLPSNTLELHLIINFLEILIEFIKLLNILYIIMIINCWFIP